MDPYYNQNYTKEQVEVILGIIQDCVRRDHYIISQNESRMENREFIIRYNLSTARQKDLLLRIVPDDFCHSLQNINPGYEHETLYVFCPQIKLFNFDQEQELVDVYTKFNIIEYGSGKRVITISFHKRNKPIEYIFR